LRLAVLERKRAISSNATPSARQKNAGIILFVLLILVVVGLHPLGSPEGSLTGEGDILREMSFLAVFFGSIFFLRVFDDLQQFFLLPFSLVILLMWCWCSLAWAVDPSIAFRRLALTTMIMWTIFLCVDIAGYAVTVKVMRQALLVGLALSYVAIVVSPSAIHQLADNLNPDIIGSWRGVFSNKNVAGPVCALLIILAFFGGVKKSDRSWIVLVAAAYFLYRTQSKTAFGFLAASLVLGYAYVCISPGYRKLLVPVLALCATIAFIIGQNYFDFSRPDTLSGRVQIWPILWLYAQNHFWLGSGYGAFWNVGASSPIYPYTRGWMVTIASGHNGYLDLLVQIGVIGLVLAIIALVIVPMWRVLTDSNIPKQQGALLVTLLAFCAGHNLTESTLLDRDQIVNVFILLTVALISKAHQYPKAHKSRSSILVPSYRPGAVVRSSQPLSQIRPQ
jgi:O-antigen ligase